MDLNIIKEDVIINEILKPNGDDKAFDCVVCMEANPNAKSINGNHRSNLFKHARMHMKNDSWFVQEVLRKKFGPKEVNEFEKLSNPYFIRSLRDEPVRSIDFDEVKSKMNESIKEQVAKSPFVALSINKYLVGPRIFVIIEIYLVDGNYEIQRLITNVERIFSFLTNELYNIFVNLLDQFNLSSKLIGIYTIDLDAEFHNLQFINKIASLDLKLERSLLNRIDDIIYKALNSSALYKELNLKFEKALSLVMRESELETTYSSKLPNLEIIKN